MPLPQHDLPIDRYFDWSRKKQQTSPFTATDWDFLTELLPQYTLRLNKNMTGIRCLSKTGISDATDQWVPVFQAIKKHFGQRFNEVNHTVCSDHLDFTIYIKRM